MSSDAGESEETGAGDPVVEARRGIDPAKKVCGNCMLWRPQRQEDSGRWVGPCRLQPGRGDLAPTAPSCDRFLARGSKIPTVVPEAPSRRRSRTLPSPLIRRPERQRPDPNQEIGDLLDMTRGELIEILREALGEGETPPLAPRWEGGTIVLKPANPELKPREIPLDSLFSKVVMIRDRLRVLEAKLNGNDKLSAAEKVELQAYITRCYGSLTTFNLLFRDKEDHFVGERKAAD